MYNQRTQLQYLRIYLRRKTEQMPKNPGTIRSTSPLELSNGH